MTGGITRALGMADDDPPESNNIVKLPTIDKGAEADEDFEKVRLSTLDLLSDATGAVKELVQIASYTQDHESYASLALLIKTVAGLNRDLVNLHGKKPSLHEPSVTNNTLVLTTQQMQELLDKKTDDGKDV